MMLMWKDTGSDMRISIASGKGGTGKSSVSVSLAAWLADSGQPVALYDCDVEEPNCHLLLPEMEMKEAPLDVSVPGLTDPDSCTECGKCAQVCRFNALAAIKTKPLIFPELCHSCGGCLLACPVEAISWIPYVPGKVRQSRNENLHLIQGVMNIGEAQATRVIKKLLSITVDEDIQIMDAPPGTSCSFMETVTSSDFILLVTEPTPFGLHDLKLALEAAKPLGIPYGIIENKAEEDVTLIRDFCRESGHPLLLSIPYSRDIAETYSRGESPFLNQKEVLEGFSGLMKKIRSRSA